MTLYHLLEHNSNVIFIYNLLYETSESYCSNSNLCSNSSFFCA